jgi:hypothetical protein
MARLLLCRRENPSGGSGGRMCNLYSLNKKRDAVARIFRISHNRAAAFEPVSAIFPGHMAPFIKQSEDGERELVVRSRGFVLLRDGYAPKRVTSATTRPARSSGTTASRNGGASCRPRLSASRTGESQRTGTGSRSRAMTSARCSLSRRLPAVEGADQKRPAERPHRGLQLHDDAAERPHRDDQSQEITGHPHGGGAVCNVAARITGRRLR